MPDSPGYAQERRRTARFTPCEQLRTRLSGVQSALCLDVSASGMRLAAPTTDLQTGNSATLTLDYLGRPTSVLHGEIVWRRDHVHACEMGFRFGHLSPEALRLLCDVLVEAQNSPRNHKPRT
jgi:hypothetical protein